MATKFQRVGNNATGFIRINKRKTLGDALEQMERIKARGGARAEKIANVLESKTKNYQRRVASSSYKRNMDKASDANPVSGTDLNEWERQARKRGEMHADLQKQTMDRALERRKRDSIERANQVISRTISG